MIIKLFIFLTLCIFFLGTYFIWFSKKNIFNNLILGLCFVAYVVPAFVIDFEKSTTPEVLDLYVLINIIGCFFYLTGIFLGYKWKRLVVVDTIMQFSFFNALSKNDSGIKKFINISSIIYIVAICGVIISFIIMGFVPLFSADPYMARFFKGQYQAPYERVAFIYRISRQLIELLMPLKILELFNKFSLKNIFLV